MSYCHRQDSSESPASRSFSKGTAGPANTTFCKDLGMKVWRF